MYVRFENVIWFSKCWWELSQKIRTVTSKVSWTMTCMIVFTGIHRPHKILKNNMHCIHIPGSPCHYLALFFVRMSFKQYTSARPLRHVIWLSRCHLMYLNFLHFSTGLEAAVHGMLRQICHFWIQQAVLMFWLFWGLVLEWWSLVPGCLLSQSLSY